jgi:small subunit ribosomal protein S9
VNNKGLKEYFISEIHQTTVRQAFATVKVDNQYDVTVNVEGGGVKGQAEAVRRNCTRFS